MANCSGGYCNSGQYIIAHFSSASITFKCALMVASAVRVRYAYICNYNPAKVFSRIFVSIFILTRRSGNRRRKIGVMDI